MVTSGYAFSDIVDSGTPIYRAEADDFAQLGAFYDRLRKNFSGITLGFSDNAGPKVIIGSCAPSLPDGTALKLSLQTLSNQPRHAYVVTLNGRHLAILVDYVQRSAMRGGPSFGTDIDDTRHRAPRHAGIMETETGKIKSLTVVEDVVPVFGKRGIYGWQWEHDLILQPSATPPLKMQAILRAKLKQFAHQASAAPVL